MTKYIDFAFSDERRTVVTAELLEEQAPIAAENLWEALAEPLRARLHHGRHCAAELWCYLPPPKEQIPYENSTVFPETGDVLYYHFIQPPTRQGRWVYDLGLFYAPGQSRLPSGWLPGDRVARIRGGDAAIRELELVAADLLQGKDLEVVLRRRDADEPGEEIRPRPGDALQDWLGRLDAMPTVFGEAEVTRVCAAAEEFARELSEWLERGGAELQPGERQRIRAGARRVAELAASWRFATDEQPPAGWNGPPVSYWRAVVRNQIYGETIPDSPDAGRGG